MKFFRVYYFHDHVSTEREELKHWQQKQQTEDRKHNRHNGDEKLDHGLRDAHNTISEIGNLIRAAIGSTVREKLAHRLRDAHEAISKIGDLISVVIGSQVSLFVMVFAIIILFLTDSGLL